MSQGDAVEVEASRVGFLKVKGSFFGDCGHKSGDLGY
jgi:hypothetical protein